MTPETLDNLNRIVVSLDQSLAHYLSDAVPYVSDDAKFGWDVVQSISENQQELVDRVGSFILQQGGGVSSGSYPIQWSALHDVSFEFLLPHLINNQNQLINVLEGCVADNYSIQARSLAEEALGQAKAHRDSLEELLEGSPTGD